MEAFPLPGPGGGENVTTGLPFPEGTALPPRGRRVAPWRRFGPLLLLALSLIPAWGPTGTGAQSLQVSGDATWTLSAGFGDAWGLEGTPYTLGMPEVSQRLRLNLSGEVVAGVRVEARLDNFQSDNLQLLSLTVQRDGWRARFGDFRLQPENPSVASSVSLKGVQVEGSLGRFTTGLTFARAQGLPAVKEFTGQSGSDTIRYLPDGPYAPLRVGGHLEARLEGAVYFDLGETAFDPDFVDALIVWVDGSDGGRSLIEVLTANELGDLIHPPPDREPVLAPGTGVLLPRGAYLTPPTGRNLLILAREPTQILRDQLQELIRLYNLANGLEGEERLTYPYSPGTASDEAFLEELHRYNTRVAVGSTAAFTEVAALHEGRTRRYYDLGHRRIEPDSVQVTAVQGGRRLDPGDVVELADLAVHYDEGILDLGAGAASLLESLDAIEVAYRYRVESNVYTLGLALALDSERVYLNGRLLTRNVEYTIDYEAGILILLVPVGPEDRLRVEYETFRGGLGGAGTYQRNVYGGRVAFEPLPGWTLSLDLVQAADVPPSPQEAASLATMPNTHTVGGLRSRFADDRWEVDLQLARSQDRFPFDDNEKPHRPNGITSLTAGSHGASPFLAAGHANGLSVWVPPEPGADPGDGSGWHRYGLGQGPAGVPVYSLTVSSGWWWLATGGGLTAVDVGGTDLVAALDSADRWHRYYESDGLPSNQVRAVAVDGAGHVWIGTQEGLVSAPITAFLSDADPMPWSRRDPGVGPAITALAVGPEGELYVAGEQGLARWDGSSFHPLVTGRSVESLAIPPAGSGWPLYAGGPTGLVALGAGGAVPVQGVPRVRALLYHQDRLWIATDEGLWVVADPGSATASPVPGAAAPLSALAAGEGLGHPGGEGLWIGSAPESGDPTALWRVADPDDPRIEAAVSFHEETLPPEDAYRYQDLPAGEHTAEGWKGSLAVTRRFDRGRLYLNALRQEAAFLPLGSTQRQELFAWEAGGRWSFSEGLTAELSHRQEDRTPLPRADLLDPGAEPDSPPYRLWVDRAALTWHPGPDVELAYQVSRRDETDTPGEDSREDRYAATVREGFLDDRLTLGVGLEEVVFRHRFDPDQDYRAQNLLGEAGARLGENLTVRLRYRRPLRVEGRDPTPARLSETVSYGLDWSGDVGPARLQLTYDQQESQERLPQEREARTRQARSRAEMAAFQAGPLSATPTLFASWRELTGWQLSDQTRAEAGAGLEVGWSHLKLGSTVSMVATDYLETGKEDDERRYSLSARWEGWEHLTPSLEWRRSHRLARLPSVEPQTSTDGQLRADLLWRPQRALSSTTSLAYADRSDRTSRTARYSLANRVSYAFSESTSASGLVEWSRRAGSTGTGLPGPADPSRSQVTAELSATHRFTPRWSAEALVGGVWGQEDREPFTSYYIRLSARLSF